MSTDDPSPEDLLPPDANGAGGGRAVPAPPALGPEAAARVPGVLGRIGRERARDYAGREAPPAAAGRAGADSEPAGGNTVGSDPVGSDPAGGMGRGAFAAALAAPGLSLIAEVKRASPSQGSIAPLDPVTAARAYRAGGARALSVLTEPRHFGGDLAHLRAVVRGVGLPALRKEFTVHPAQVTEAREAGASAVLLIVALLGDLTGPYLRFAHALDLDVLVEVHDEAELELAVAAGAQIIGVNNRDLRTLEIDLRTAPRLMRRARELGHEGLLVAESGYGSAADLAGVLGLADAALVGTSLAGSGDLEAATRALLRDIEAARRA